MPSGPPDLVPSPTNVPRDTPRASPSTRSCGLHAAGLVAGKLVGVLGATWVAIRSGVAVSPRGITTRHLVVLGAAAGIGFTMALFVAGLGFDDPQQLATAKLGVLAGSVCAGLLALGFGRAFLPVDVAPGAKSADEAEAFTELRG